TTAAVAGVTENGGNLTITGTLNTSAGFAYTAGTYSNGGTLGFTGTGSWSNGTPTWGNVTIAAGAGNTVTVSNTLTVAVIKMTSGTLDLQNTTMTATGTVGLPADAGVLTIGATG